MEKKYLLILSFFLCISAFAQSNISLKGKVLDKNTQVPIEAATVFLTSVKDSTVIDYTISDKNGFFRIDTKSITKPFFLKISYMGYQTFKKEIQSIAESKDFGILQLLENPNNLNEVVVKSEAPPIRIKKDTLEFSASSFKVRPDSNVETLLKQLPGVEVGTDGKITVNGKEVNQVLVNGKPFFDKDGKIALQSLPSDIINKVQITDTKTKKEELNKQASTSNNASINLTIDEKKNKGLFGKFMGGFGSDDRYESSALINYFQNKRKISVLASSNNINSTGFSMDEIFDNMGGGRNSSMSYNSDGGSFTINGNRFGSGKGITRSNMLGVNYADELVKDLESSGSYFFSSSNADNVNRTKMITFLPTGAINRESEATTNGENFGHNLSFQLEYKIDSTASIFVGPKFTKSNSTYNTNSFEKSMNDSGQLVNESTAQVFDDSDRGSFSNSINFNKRFKRKGRFLSLSFDNENSKETVSSLNKTNTVFYQGSNAPIIRDQIRKNRNLVDKYSAEVEYSEPVTDSLNITFGLNYNSELKSDDRNTYDFDLGSQSYSIANAELTNYMTSDKKTFRPQTGFSLDNKKLNFSATVGPSIVQFANNSFYLGTPTNLTKDYVLPYATARLSYRLNKSKSIYLNYSYDYDFPNANQVLPVEDLSNPLSTVIGNVDLKPSSNQWGYFSFRNYDYATRSGYSVYFGGNLYGDQVVSAVTYDSSIKNSTTFENVSGTYSSWFGSSWNKTIKREAHNFKYGLGFSANYGLSKGFINDEMFEAKTLRLNPKANFTYEYGELLTINPTYNFTYNDSKYKNYKTDGASSFIHRFNIQTTNYWPKNWVFGNDFGYTYNSNIADGFKKDFYLWNTSLAYSFFDKKMTAKVKVYDILNQNQSATRTISPTNIRDEENTVLKRYVMFSLTYKLNKFGGKEKPSGNRMIFH
ncbi:outer membrane beta-barrel protein [Flavobacterium weaverense]|uniref:Outer membrane receptor protein involved in Fe transport n=1 Tax=Flavobacterium weaverense TaxID=271156 RepID=A0A3L9ZZ55_9FLAO|nr:outer membrane beta-barrel protein [Flavobacterium weaverense]RMA78013.1 outer membrane receptor protein involved in Fe transport [Flavobacterium weaverense]